MVFGTHSAALSTGPLVSSHVRQQVTGRDARSARNGAARRASSNSAAPVPVKTCAKRMSPDGGFKTAPITSPEKRARDALWDITNGIASETSSSQTTITQTASLFGGDSSLGGSQPTTVGVLCADGELLDATRVDVSNKEPDNTYVTEIFQSLRNTEKRHTPSPNYLNTVQSELTDGMRAILVDWLVEVATEYQVQEETTSLAISLIDRYLSVVPVLRCKLQLVGVTAMWIASKYEEIDPPTLTEMCTVSDHLYSKSEVLACERKMLAALGYQLTSPTAITFLNRYNMVSLSERKLVYLSNYLTELSLLDYRMLHFLPSKIAASALLLARVTLGKPAWSSALQLCTGYTCFELEACVRDLHAFFIFAKNLSTEGVKDKYALHAKMCVSTINAQSVVLPEMIFAHQ